MKYVPNSKRLHNRIVGNCFLVCFKGIQAAIRKDLPIVGVKSTAEYMHLKGRDKVVIDNMLKSAG